MFVINSLPTQECNKSYFLSRVSWFKFTIFFLQELSLPYCLITHSQGRTERFMPFPRTLVQYEMLTTISRIWTQVVESISYDDNNYAKCASCWMSSLLEISALVDSLIPRGFYSWWYLLGTWVYCLALHYKMILRQIWFRSPIDASSWVVLSRNMLKVANDLGFTIWKS